MKKIIIATVSILIIFALSAYFYIKNEEAKKNSIPTQPVFVAHLRESLENKKVNLETACANPETIEAELRTRFTYLCEDIKLSKEIEDNFGSNHDYRYFLNCAKTHSENMQQITNDLKEHYPEDYKELNFNKNNQEAILIKYLKHPKTAYLMAQCESKTEAIYWKNIVESGKVEDLKFCLQITEDCLSGKSKPEECPANFKSYHDECSKNLKKMKH